MSELEADVVVLGAGGAGSALLIALDLAWQAPAWREHAGYPPPWQDSRAAAAPSPPGDPGQPPRIIVVDPVRREGDDRTWCFWHEGAHPLDGLSHRSWTLAEVVAPDGRRVVLDLDPFRYVMLRSSDVYARAREAGRRLGARWITGTAEDPHDGQDGASVQVGDATIRARWVFDSRPGTSPRAFAGRTTAWIQHFRGWTVRFPPDVAVDVHVPTLMDLTTEQHDRAVTFGYVLPLDPDRALVEFTVFSPASAGRWERDRYERELQGYLKRRWGLHAGDVRVESVEDGVIPMTDGGDARRAGRSVMRLGTAGGATRGSTGYTFAAMYRQAEAVADRLRVGRTPVPPRAYPRRHRAIDGVLLTALDAGLVDGARLLGSLWVSQPPDRMLRFLDGVSSPGEELRLMAAAPPAAMARATGIWVTRRSRAVRFRHRRETES